jgi:hypothetical protein
MLVTEQFVFVHVPKTGGSFVRTLIHTHMQVVAEYPGHASYDRLPPEFANLPALRIVRNPWDWYVSHYHYAHAQGKPGLAGDLFFGPDRRAPFPEFIAAVCATPELPSSVGGPGPRWMRAMKELDCDFYTALDHVMVGGRPNVEAGRFEHLREDLLAFLGRHDIAVGETFREAILASPVIHPPHGPTDRESYPSYYDERLRDLVRFRCPLVPRYGYEFEGEPARLRS